MKKDMKYKSIKIIFICLILILSLELSGCNFIQEISMTDNSSNESVETKKQEISLSANYTHYTDVVPLLQSSDTVFIGTLKEYHAVEEDLDNIPFVFTYYTFDVQVLIKSSEQTEEVTFKQPGGETDTLNATITYFQNFEEKQLYLIAIKDGIINTPKQGVYKIVEGNYVPANEKNQLLLIQSDIEKIKGNTLTNQG